ncbi:hypothetical protein Tco_0974132 [Tanacetum coccineum]|uniref:Uncharacterized protein n=1 Tax=Tanacetum coccineum TaxID=301880 RepID=A0ABQ5EAQ4_9ASTR
MIAHGSSRWKPTGKIFKTVGLRWVPTGKIFAFSTNKVDSEPINGSNDDITNQYECKQTLDVSAVRTRNSRPQQIETSVQSSVPKLFLKQTRQTYITTRVMRTRQSMANLRHSVLEDLRFELPACQGDSLNLPDHRIHKDGDGDGLIPVLIVGFITHTHAQKYKRHSIRHYD